MKLTYLLPLLIPILTSPSLAADLAPGEITPLLQDSLPLSRYRLGLDFVETRDAADYKVIGRRFQLALGLPADMEFGFALQDTQESAVDHRQQAMGGQTWLRWNFLRSSLIKAAATLQYQPGLSNRSSAFQASQDRTTLGFDLKLQPVSYVSTAVYTSYSRRQDERFQDLALGQEALMGARLSLGTENIGVYADGLQRKLSAKYHDTGASKELFAREWKAGLYFSMANAQLSAYALIPDSHRYFGTQDRGFGVSLSMTLGQSTPPDPRDRPEDALIATEKADRETAAAKRAEASQEIKVLETNEMDEFQSLEVKRKEQEKNQKESPAEKAERELRESLELEKSQQAQKAKEQEKAKREADRARHQQILEDNEKYREYKDDVEKELNEYTLPDQDDAKWNGLNP